MDQIDNTLLSALRRDARLPIASLAALAGVSRATAKARIDRMRADGTIRSFTVMTGSDLALAPVRGLMLLSIEGAAAERVGRRLLGLPEVAQVHSTNGKWDLIAEIGTASLPEFDRVLADIRRIPGVAASETSLLLSTRQPR